jgi:hypothetical protein
MGLETIENKYGIKPISIITDIEEEQPTEAFESLSNKIAGIIISSKPQFTIGIYGEWGTGKTTLMKAIQRKFREKENKETEWVPTAWFNAWRFEREKEQATIPLILTILEALYRQITKQQKDEGWYAKFKGKLANYVKGWSFSLSIPIAFAELEISRTDNDNTTQISKPSIQEGLDLIKELAKKIDINIPSGVKLVVFIDDLDRCSPKKAIQVLESTKILLNIEGLVYVLGLSHDTIDRLITAEYEKSMVRGRDYIKKIIQIPIRVPTWVEKDFKEILAKNIRPEINPNYYDILKGKVNLLRTAVKGNPRELKRFVNSFILGIEVFGEKESIKEEKLLVVELMRAMWYHFFDYFSVSKPFRDSIREYLKEGDEILYQKLTKLREKKESEVTRIEKQILEIEDDLWDFLNKTSSTLFQIENWDDYRSVTKVLKEEQLEGEEEKTSESLDRENLISLLANGKTDLFNEIRKKSGNSLIDLRGATFRNIELDDVNLSNANLIGTDFSNSTLSRISFTKSYLNKVYFRETKIRDSDFILANLRGANFKGSQIDAVVFDGADLRAANFKNVKVGPAKIHVNELTKIDSSTNFEGSNIKPEVFQ